MCTYRTLKDAIRGSGLAQGEWFRLADAVVAFDHPSGAPLEHALCIDFRGASGDPSERVAVELDAASARRLAELVLSLLDSEEVRELSAANFT